jgi:histidinol phosphatase-like PHP family hydrolase
VPTDRLGKTGPSGNLVTQIRADPNIIAAGLLQDLATLQSSERSRFGYKRAGKVIARMLDRSVADLVAQGSLRDVPYLGKATERVVTELVQTGESASVARAIADSPRRGDVEARRQYRRAYLSRHALHLVFDAALDDAIVAREHYAGDLQMHSTWSDGVESIDGLAEAAIALGWSRIGVSDHSYGLPIAGGMSMDAAREQHRQIEALNEQLGSRLRVYCGVEANILADGSLDLQPEERREFEYVIASPHSALRRDTDQTARMLAAVSLPHVAILGHPRGRMYNARPGITADWTRVFREAARRNVAIEIDGDWHRQDVDYELAALALDAGCVFALDSDAHSIQDFPYTDYAIAHARVAMIPADRIVNCWPADRFDAWLEDRRSPSTRRRTATRARARSSARRR